MTVLRILTLLFAVALVSAAPSIRVVQPGVSGTTGALSFADSFCPFAFSPTGFSVECVIPGATSVRFFVDSKQVSEQAQAPFVVGGHTGGNVAAWTGYRTGVTQVSCVGNNGIATIWRGNIECVGSPTPSPSPLPPQPPVSATNCVALRGDTFSPPLTNGWVLDPAVGSLTYEPDNNSTGIVGSGRAQLRYRFMVPVAATYGLTLDMGTAHPTEHNDVFVQFSEGITRRRDSSVKPPSTGFLKAYHNANGRSKQVFSVDFNAHTLSVSKLLVPGVEYTVVVAARSTKTTIYGVLLFPCREANCQSGKPQWQQYLGLCNV